MKQSNALMMDRTEAPNKRLNHCFFFVAGFGKHVVNKGWGHMLSSKEKNKIVTTCSLGEYCPFCALGETKGWWKKTAPSSTFQELFDVEKNGYQEMLLVKGCWQVLQRWWWAESKIIQQVVYPLQKLCLVSYYSFEARRQSSSVQLTELLSSEIRKVSSSHKISSGKAAVTTVSWSEIRVTTRAHPTTREIFSIADLHNKAIL